MGLIDILKNWIKRKDSAEINWIIVKTQNKYYEFEFSGAEIDIIDYGSGYTVEELIIEADEVKIYDR